MSRHSNKPASKGTALLAVLWLTAALSAIAFSVADTVRAEVDRSIATQESTRAYYLARGAVERVLFLIRNNEDGSGMSPAERFAGRRRLYFREETGDTFVELLSERGKLPLRSLNPGLLERLLIALGESPTSAALITSQAFGSTPVYSENSAAVPAFRPSFASMENVEELLLVPGITPELVYGRYTRMPDGSLVNMGGLIDCLSPYVKNAVPLDSFSVHPSLLVAMGMDPSAARTFSEARRNSANYSGTAAVGGGVNARADLGDVFQIRATGRPRLPDGTLSPTRRTVALLIKYVTPNPRYMWLSPWTHLRWYDQSFSDVAAGNAVWFTPSVAGTRP